MKTDDWRTLSAADEPPGSGWRVQLAKTHPGHHLSLPTSKRQQLTAKAGPPVCPNPDWAAAAQQAGLLSVKLFGAFGKGNGTEDDAPAVRRAINASLVCGGCVFFPPGQYQFHTTVEIGGGCFKGGGFSVPEAGVDGNSQPQVNIYGPNPGGPAIAIIDAGSGVMMQDLTFWGGTTAIYIGNSAGIRFVNVGAGAGADGDGVNTTAAGCNATGCNVVLGSMSAAMVVENSVRLLKHAQHSCVAALWLCQ